MGQGKTVKPCTKCGETKPLGMFSKESRSKDGVRSKCKGCVSMDMKPYTAARKSVKREYDTKYCEKNKEKIALRQAKYREDNKDKLEVCRYKNREKRAASFARYSAKNADRLREYRLARYAQNPSKYIEIANAYRKANPEKRAQYRKDNKLKLTVHWHTRRARKVSAGGSYTDKEISDLMRKQKNRCPVCGVGISSKYHIDHVMPLALGGTNFINNIQLLCPPCNLSKGARHPMEFMRSRGFLL